MRDIKPSSQNTIHRHIAQRAYYEPTNLSTRAILARYTGFTPNWITHNPESSQAAVCSRHMASIFKAIGATNLDSNCPYCAGKIS